MSCWSSAAVALHGYQTAVYVTAVTAALFVLLSLAGLLSGSRGASRDRADIEMDAVEAETLGQAA